MSSDGRIGVPSNWEKGYLALQEDGSGIVGMLGRHPEKSPRCNVSTDDMDIPSFGGSSKNVDSESELRRQLGAALEFESGNEQVFAEVHKIRYIQDSARGLVLTEYKFKVKVFSVDNVIPISNTFVSGRRVYGDGVKTLAECYWDDTDDYEFGRLSEEILETFENKSLARLLQ